MIFYKAILEPFYNHDISKHCVVVLGGEDDTEMKEYEIFFDYQEEAEVVWKSFLNRFEFHTTDSIDEVIVAYREKQEKVDESKHSGYQ